MLTFLISLVVIFLVFSYCDSIFDMLIVYALIILFVCLVRDWSLNEFIKHFIEMFNPVINWLENHNIKIKN